MMRPKKPDSTSRASFNRPGRNSLSCTTPTFTPASRARRASASADSTSGVTGFSQYTCLPAAIAFSTAGGRADVSCASK